MITIPTVLVFSAGVSMSYGYPSGTQLVQEILESLGSPNWETTLSFCRVEKKERDEFKTELFMSQQPSVDIFLERRVEFTNIGKLCIALSLMSRENNGNLINFKDRSNSPYHYLFSKFDAKWVDFINNKISFITFNYDRSFEHFLFTALKHTHNRSDEETSGAINSILIIHVHGNLGPLPWQEPEGRPYGPLFHSTDEFGTISNKRVAERHMAQIARIIDDASKRIIIVSEGQDTTKEFENARHVLSNAERIYFLGFGYYSVNLERLDIKNSHIVDPSIIAYGPNVRIMPFRGSALGLGQAERVHIQNTWRIALPDNQRTALEFMKEYADLN